VTEVLVLGHVRLRNDIGILGLAADVDSIPGGDAAYNFLQH